MWRPRHSICDKAIRGRAPLLVYSRLCCRTKACGRDEVTHVTQTYQYSSQNKVPKVSKRKPPTSISLDLKDLPQGLLPCKPVSATSQDEAPTYPTVVLQAQTNMRKFENCVLLTRVGGFYELYFEHAEEFGPLLNLKIAQKKTNAGPVSMAGFPFFQLDRFLKILVQDLNRYVAIAEEFANDASAKVKAGGLLHDRKVARIVTPGTLIDENFIDPFTNNYVLAIQRGRRASQIAPEDASELIGLAWLDLSTGNFYTQSTTLALLSGAISRIGPREVVLEEEEKKAADGLLAVLSDDRHVITYCSAGERKPMTSWGLMLESNMTAEIAASFASEEADAGSLLLEYVGTRLQGTSLKLQPPVQYRSQEVMAIDRNSLRGLEIMENYRDGTYTGSLLHALRKTVTKSGSRLLKEWLGAPSTSLEVINDRLDIVGHILGDTALRERLMTLLRRCHDSQRLVQKFALGRGNADDLLALSTTISATQELALTIRESLHGGKAFSESLPPDSLSRLVSRIQLDGPLALASKIKNAIDEEGVVHQHQIEDEEAGTLMEMAEQIATTEGSMDDIAAVKKGRGKKSTTSIREHYGEDSQVWIMKPLASTALKRLHADLLSLDEDKAKLHDNLQRELDASTLALRWTPGLGHICHVKGKDAKRLAEMRSVSSSKSTKSFHHPEWTELGRRIDQVRLQIRAEEQRVFQKLREEVIKTLVKLRRNATVLDELDVACSFATHAKDQGLVRPVLNNTVAHKVMGGRHPTVQVGLQQQGRTFVTNDCLVGDEDRLWIITGPNMGGKSTFLRQNALITIMAQVGSFVPAEYAEIGIVDQIFSRVGSADDLYRNQSTFMVEMMETATILKHATERSFVIMDEIGRGTTPEDGIARRVQLHA
ncbi:hypothetical protein V495_07712 [Pseudogymnoascus sp. VKM F-4514 (FW-929)]|nr:hypothetical protein V495_07712 [Pseudogymnoascus sp. VKM F-4514 (FW-929)]KFY55041.1 hypothetical protein V497_07234 [Pseudogymnoascus sp. VKM F-4516 (FW-969)]